MQAVFIACTKPFAWAMLNVQVLPPQATFAHASCLHDQNVFEQTENGRENIDCNNNTTKNKTLLSFKHPTQF